MTLIRHHAAPALGLALATLLAGCGGVQLGNMDLDLRDRFGGHR